MGGGSKQPTTTTNIQKVELPAWVDNASQENYAFAKQVADRPFEQYQGPLVAGLSAGEQAAPGIMQAGMASAAGMTGQAQTALQRAAAYNPSMIQNIGSYLGVNAPGAVNDVAQSGGVAGVGQVGNVADVSAQRFDGAALKNYLNPYTDNVVNTTLSGMRDNLAISGQKADDAARGAGAFGSSRSGVMQAVLQSQGAKDMASTEAGLRSAAYTDAAGRLMTDNASALQAAMANQNSALTTQGRNVAISQGNQSSQQATEALNAGIRQGNQSSALQTAAQNLQAQMANQSAYGSAQGQNLAAQQSNQSAGLAGAQLGLSAGTALGGLASDTVNNAGKSALLSSQLGANERSVQQAQYDADAAKWQAAYDAPLTALNTRLAALGMSPYGKTTTTTETKPNTNTSNGALSAIGGVMSFLPMLFGSDERLKKNVETVGTTEAGVPLKQFEYKGFMGRKMPGKQVGVMAQDMEKVRPDAVHRFRGDDGKSYRAVDYSKVGRGFMGRKRAA